MASRQARRVSVVAVVVALLAVLGPPTTATTRSKSVRLVFASTNFPVGTSPQTSLPIALGYWQQEGLDVDLQGAAGSLPSLQMVATGKADVGVVQPLTLFQTRLKGADVKAFYTFVRRNWFFPAVLEGSPVTRMQDLKGKTIGVQSMGASMIPFMRLALADAGLDPFKDVTFVSVGLGAGAAGLLQQGRVDALGLWSAQYALMENAGFVLRKFPDVPPIKDLSFAVAFVAREGWLRDNGETAVGIGRGVAKATLFALHNPEAAVRLHWKLFPQTRTAGEDDALSMRKALHELNDGLAFMRIDDARVRRWGATSREEVEAYASVLVRARLLDGKPGSPDDYYTGAFIDRINAFDEASIIRQAKTFR